MLYLFELSLLSPLSSFSPFLSPKLALPAKSQSASAAPAASDSVLRSREALSLRTQTRTHTHTCYSPMISQRRWAGGGSLKNDNNSACRSQHHLQKVHQTHTHTHTFINPLTKSIYFLPRIAALSQVVKK